MKYYCIGIKGTGMSTLAQILADLGNEVSGYDDAKEYKFTEEGLRKRGIKIYYDSEHGIDKDTIVTHSVAFSDDHKEIKRVKELGLQIKKYNEILGEVVSMFDTTGVSGTHGKTTTSSMIKHIFENTIGCNYFIGAGDGYASKENEKFVIEADEFNRHFLAYHPNYAIITNIEEEHMEIYNDLEDIKRTFNEYANNTKKLVIACGDNENVRSLDYKTEVIFYGFNDNNDVIAKDEKVIAGYSEFDVYYNGEKLEHFKLPLVGHHMVLNATAAIMACYKQGISLEDIKNNLLTFKNAKRRFVEEKVKDTVIIDDYAHHPTEIRVTLEAARLKYPDKKLIAIFKPNTYSRTRDFKEDFAKVLGTADEVYLTEIDCNREKSEDYDGVTSRTITDLIPESKIIDENTLEGLGDINDKVICVMSCAYTNHLIDNIKKKLEN